MNAQEHNTQRESAWRSGQWILWFYCVLVFGGMGVGVAIIWWVLWWAGGC